jgi:hypothetical protein
MADLLHFSTCIAPGAAQWRPRDAEDARTDILVSKTGEPIVERLVKLPGVGVCGVSCALYCRVELVALGSDFEGRSRR